MRQARVVWCEDFRIDLRDERLCRGQHALPLTPKAFAVLRHLIAQPGQLVTKTALFDAIWPDTAVGDAVLTVGICEPRAELSAMTRARRDSSRRCTGAAIGLWRRSGRARPPTSALSPRVQVHRQTPHSMSPRMNRIELRTWRPHALSSGARRRCASSTPASEARSTGSARWCSCPVSPASARRPWWGRSWSRSLGRRRAGPAKGSASSTMGLVRRTCPYSGGFASALPPPSGVPAAGDPGSVRPELAGADAWPPRHTDPGRARPSGLRAPPGSECSARWLTRSKH
jgi:Transcriptional regulatory protein, C terminal